LKYYIEIDGDTHEVEIPNPDNRTQLIIDGKKVELDAPAHIDSHGISFSVNNRPYRVEISADVAQLNLQINHSHYQAKIQSERQKLKDKFSRSDDTKNNSVGEIKASMPGLIIKLNVSIGDIVSKYKSLIVMEAMKMENEINSPLEGKVDQCLVEAGQAVSKGQLLMIIK